MAVQSPQTTLWTRLCRTLPLLAHYREPTVVARTGADNTNTFVLDFENSVDMMRLTLRLDIECNNELSPIRSSYVFYDIDGGGGTSKRRTASEGDMMQAEYVRGLLELLDAHFVHCCDDNDIVESEERGG